MIRLLVSVRDADEAGEALAGGAHVVDAKEPARGPMGRCDDDVIAAIIAAVDQRVQVSAALGELTGEISPPPGKLAFAKVGLLGWRGNPEWPARWVKHRAALPIGCRAIIAAYADANEINVPSPPVDEVIEFACRAGAGGVLIDTALKNGATLCDFLDRFELQAIVDRCRSAHVMIALAGSLDLAQIERLLPLRPDLFAVRGAVCAGGRLGRVQAAKVQALARLIGQS